MRRKEFLPLKNRSVENAYLSSTFSPLLSSLPGKKEGQRVNPNISKLKSIFINNLNLNRYGNRNQNPKKNRNRNLFYKNLGLGSGLALRLGLGLGLEQSCLVLVV